MAISDEISLSPIFTVLFKKDFEIVNATISALENYKVNSCWIPVKRIYLLRLTARIYIIFLKVLMVQNFH